MLPGKESATYKRFHCISVPLILAYLFSVCCTTEPCFDMTSRVWLAWVWRLLLSWAFTLSLAFFQFWNGFVTQTNPVCCVASLVCLQTLQKAPLMSSSAAELVFPVLWVFSLRYQRLNQLSTSLLGGRLSNARIGIRTLDPFSVWVLELATEEDVLTPKKERISISSYGYLIDLSTLANYIKKSNLLYS